MTRRLLTTMTLLLANFLYQIDTAPSTCVSSDPYAGYICTNDPIYVRRMMDKNKEDLGDSHLVGRGVVQRVEGTDQEKKAVKSVLRRMDEFFKYEVLSKLHYEPVRNRCRNNNELCAFWASVNECDSNRIFMLQNCAAACRLCLLASTDFTGRGK